MSLSKTSLGKRGESTTIIPESLVRLVIAILLLVAVIAIAAKPLSVTDTTARERFFDMVELIEKMGREQPGSFADLTLVMDKDSAIIGFARNAEKVTYKTYGYPFQPSSIISRPQSSECRPDQACLCLCTKNIVAAGDEKDVPMPVRCDGKLLCKGISSDFPLSASTEQLQAPRAPIPLLENVRYEFTGGFHFGGSKTNVAWTWPLPSLRSLIFVEKGDGDLIGLCFEEPPCFVKAS